MNYGFKVTTNGRALLAKCIALEQSLILSRVSVGSGHISEDTDLADMVDLVQYVADGRIEHRKHEGQQFSFTVQYANSDHPEVGMFYLTEFAVYAKDPENRTEVTLLYATLGDYQQPVPAYSEGLPPSVWDFPVMLVVSDKIDVSVGSPAGFVTYTNLEREVQDACKKYGTQIRLLELTLTPTDWTQDDVPNDMYTYHCDIPAENVTENMVPIGAIKSEYTLAANQAGMLSGCETLDGCIRFFAKCVPKQDIQVHVTLLLSGDTDGSDSTASSYTLASNEEVTELIQDIFGV